MSNTINSQIRFNQYQSSKANTEPVSGAQNIGYLEGRSNIQIGSDQLLTTRTTAVNNDPKNYIAMQPIYDTFYQICSRERLAYPHDEELKTAYKELKIQIEQVKVENIDVKDAHGKTLLHYASQLKQPDIAEQLIEKGADINSQNKYKQTPLHYASEAKFGRTTRSLVCSDVFDLLLLKKANPNIQDNQGETPLHLSALEDIDKSYVDSREYGDSRTILSNSINIVKKLIKAGANPNIKNDLGNTPLNKFIGYPIEDCRDIVNTLMAQPSCDVNTKNNEDNTPLHKAVRLENNNAINKLLEKKADCNIQNKDGETPLHVLVTYNISSGTIKDKLKMVEKLIKAGAKLDIKNNFGHTSLSQLIIKATLVNKNDIAKKFIKKNPVSALNDTNTQGNTLFHRLMFTCNIEVITYILENYKIAINVENKNGNTPLHILCDISIPSSSASSRKVIDLINKLIEYGANINAKNKQGNTPLVLNIFMNEKGKDFYGFINKGYSDIAMHLIECGANLNIKNNNDDTPLHLVIRFLSSREHMISSVFEISKILIKRSEDINVQNKDGNTPLHEATRVKDSSLIFMLLDKGANLNIKNNLGNTPLNQIMENANIATADIIETFIINGAEVNTINEEGNSPLHKAMQFKKPYLIDIFLTHGANPNIQNKNGCTPLHIVQDLKTAERLIKAGVSLKIKNNLGNTPLNQIMENANIATVEIIETFIKNGAEVNTQNNKGNTPLHKAMKTNNLYVINVLLTHGAKPNIQNKNGCTPLHMVQGLKTAERLIKAGASLKIKNNLENTPLNQIMDNANIATAEMIKTFIKNGAEVNTQNNEDYTPLHKAMKMNNLYVINVLLTHGVNLDIKNKYGNTPLHLVPLKIAERVIKAGASLNIKNNLGNTPLNKIMANTNIATADIIETFIINGAEINTQNDEGNTPLHKAMQFKKTYLLDVLLIHGANPNIQNKNGNIPLHTALDLETAQILIQAGADLRIKNNLGNTPLNQIEKLEQEDKPKVNHATTYNLDKIDLKELGDFNLSNIVLHQIVNRLVENRNDITDVFNKMHEIFKNALPSKTIESFLSLMSARSTSSRELFSIESLQTITRDLGKKIFFTKILEMHNIPLLVKALKANLYNENILYLCLFHAFINNDVTIYQEIDKSIKNKTIKFKNNEIKLFYKMHKIFVKMKSTDDKQMLTTAEIITKYFSKDYLKEIAINLGIETFFTIILDMQNINLLYKVMETGLCNNNIIALGLFHAFIYGNHEIYDIFEKHIKNNISTFNNKELIALLQVPDYKNGVRILAEEAKQVAESETNQLFKKYIEFICSIEKLDKTEKFTILLHSKILNTLENQQIICEYFSIDDLKKIADDLNTEIFFTKIIEMQNIALLYKAMDAGLCDNNTISSNLLHQINALSKAL